MGAARVPARPSWGGVGALGAAWLLAAQPGPGHADGIPHCLKHQLQQAEGTEVPRAAAPWHGGSRVKARLAHGDRGDTSHRQKGKGKTCQLAVIRAVIQSRRHLQSNMFTVISLAAQQGPAPHAHQIYPLPEVKAGLRSKQSWGRSAKSCPSMSKELLVLIECKQAPRLLQKAEALQQRSCSPSLLVWG